MKFAIIDDVASDRDHLSRLLTDYCEMRHLVCEISCFEGANPFLNTYAFDVYSAIFLDNLMEGMNGIETARLLRRRGDSLPIIFTTTEESYALEGYTVQAMDYLVKPIQIERLTDTMNRLVSLSSRERYVDITENRVPRRLRLGDILYVSSFGHYLEIFMRREQLRSYMTMEAFKNLLRQAGEPLESLQERRFLNCCRGYLINLDYVQSLEAKEFLLINGAHIPISRARYREMKESYATYLFAKTRESLVTVHGAMSVS